MGFSKTAGSEIPRRFFSLSFFFSTKFKSRLDFRRSRVGNFSAFFFLFLFTKFNVFAAAKHVTALDRYSNLTRGIQGTFT